MRIAQVLLSELIEHALLEAPKECCGMIASRDGEAVQVLRASNAAESEYRFEIDGPEQMGLLAGIEVAGLELGAIYHSHTHAEPYPSQLDILTWAYPRALMMIVGVPLIRPEGARAGMYVLPYDPVVRAYTIADEIVSEVELTVT